MKSQEIRKLSVEEIRVKLADSREELDETPLPAGNRSIN